ncbi:MAG: hypothetical protein EOO75_06320 [Myxococcales bacterium]|nr:MAG: hypothetical protein EOO75_06320 [Myxococcales bacterium]
MDQPPPSLPPSHPSYRHLGTAAVDRSVRVQMIIALVAGLVMVAVPLYLWRRPKTETGPDHAGARPAASASASSLAASALDSPALSASAAANRIPGLLLSEPKLVGCTEGRKKLPPEQCDRPSYFEESLLRAIQENASCAPGQAGGSSINFVLDIDHKAKRLKAWAGKSGSMKAAQRKKVVECIRKAMPNPDWAALPHQHQKYQIAVLATYP